MLVPPPSICRSEGVRLRSGALFVQALFVQALFVQARFVQARFVCALCTDTGPDRAHPYAIEASMRAGEPYGT